MLSTAQTENNKMLTIVRSEYLDPSKAFDSSTQSVTIVNPAPTRSREYTFNYAELPQDISFEEFVTSTGNPTPYWIFLNTGLENKGILGYTEGITSEEKPILRFNPPKIEDEITRETISGYAMAAYEYPGLN